MSSTAGAIDRRPRGARDEALRQLFSLLSQVLLAILFVLAAVLAARRVSGSLVIPLGSGAILLAALSVETAAIACRRFPPPARYLALSTRYFRNWPQGLSLSAPTLIISGLAALVILASLTIRGTPILELLLAWLILISAESLQWLLHYRPELMNVGWLNQLTPLPHRAAEVDQPGLPRGLVQQLTRAREGEQESIHAMVRAEIAAHDRLGVVHLSFCPPLAGLPRLSAHVIETEDAEVRITQAETFGTRLEVRLSAAADAPRTVMVEVFGSATARQAVLTPLPQPAAPVDQDLA